jgi:hypothetical protein
VRVTYIVGQEALANTSREEFKPGVQFQTDEDLARLAADYRHHDFFHRSARRRWSHVDDRWLVDSHLRVRGVTSLRVVDAGVMPLITSGSLNSTLMIAEKAVSGFRQRGLKSNAFTVQAGVYPQAFLVRFFWEESPNTICWVAELRSLPTVGPGALRETEETQRVSNQDFERSRPQAAFPSKRWQLT